MNDANLFYSAPLSFTFGNNNMKTLALRSTRGQRTLTFSNPLDDYFDVELAGDGASAKKRIWRYSYTAGLIDLFASIARDWRGWKGARDWEAIEGDLAITATSDSLGHIRIDVTILNQDLEDDWRLSAPIFLDAGNLGEISASMSAFFTDDVSQ